METLLIACTLTGLTCLTLGTVGGFVLGMAGRIFFRHNFKEFVQENMAQGQEQLNNQIQKANNQVQGMIAQANAQAAEIYKAAATEALRAGIKHIPAPPPGTDFN